MAERSTTNIRLVLGQQLKALGRLPTVRELAAAAEVTPETIDDVVQQLTADANPLRRLLTERVLDKLYQQASEGDNASIKLWFQYIEAWAPPTSSKPATGFTTFSDDIKLRIIHAGQPITETAGPDEEQE